MTSKTPFMPIYVADYFADTRHLRTVEHGAYLLLLMTYWQNGCLPKDDKRLSQIACMRLQEWVKIKSTIAEFFDSEWNHKRVEREIVKAVVKSQRRAEYGSLGGKAKSLKNHNASVAKATHLLEQNASKPVACALASSSEIIKLSKDNLTRAREDALSLSEEFEKRFWPLYPHKIGKGVAKRSFKAARRRVELQPMMDGLVAYMRTKPASREWCNPSTWLNQDRWLDQPAGANMPVPQGLSVVSQQVFVDADSEAGLAWWDYTFQKTGKYPPRNAKGGWYFPTEYPPRTEAAE